MFDEFRTPTRAGMTHSMLSVASLMPQVLNCAHLRALIWRIFFLTIVRDACIADHRRVARKHELPWGPKKDAVIVRLPHHERAAAH
jgi:hypothetical protein